MVERAVTFARSRVNMRQAEGSFTEKTEERADIIKRKGKKERKKKRKKGTQEHN